MDEEPRFPDAARLALDGVTAALVGSFAIYVGLGQQNGFRNPESALGAVAALPWSLPAGAVGAVLLGSLYANARRPWVRPLAGVFGFVRFFLLFPVFLGFVPLGFCLAGWAFLRGHFIASEVGGEGPDYLDDSWQPRADAFGWYLAAPLSAADLVTGGDIPRGVSEKRLRWVLPLVAAVMAVSTNPRLFDTETPVGPSGVAAFATFYLADALIVCRRLAPVMHWRRRHGVPLL